MPPCPPHARCGEVPRWTHAPRGGPPSGGRTPRLQPRQPRAHARGLPRRARRGRRGSRVRRAADRRRAPGVRARPARRPGQHRPRGGLDDGARAARRARLRLLEEPLGRPRRRGPGGRRPDPAGAHPGAAAAGGARTTTSRWTWPSRPSTPPGTPAWWSAGWWTCSTPFGWAGAGSPARIMSFSPVALTRVKKLAPDLEVVLLIDRQYSWQMATSMLGPRVDRRTGHRPAPGEPPAGPPAAQAGPPHPRVDGEHDRGPRPVRRPRAWRP